MRLDLDAEELHLLVTWGYAIRELDAGQFGEAEQALLEKLRALRGEHGNQF